MHVREQCVVELQQRFATGEHHEAPFARRAPARGDGVCQEVCRDKASAAVTVANGSTFVEDFGVFYASSGVQLTPVAASPTQGQYVAPSGSPGSYTFNSADNGAGVLVYYSYTITSGNKISLANQLTGPLPMFEISLKETFSYFGTSKDLLVKLNACVSPKLSLPFSSQKFTVAEFDFQAIADAANNIGTISLSE